MSSKKLKKAKGASTMGWKILIAFMIAGTSIFFLFPELQENLLSQVSSRTGQYSSGGLVQDHLTPKSQDEYEVHEEEQDNHEEDRKEEVETVDTEYSFKDLIGAGIVDDVDKVRRILKRNPELKTAADGNGWQIIHEVSRAHARNVLKVLVEEFGADVNIRTDKDGKGYTPLALALRGPNNVQSTEEKESGTVSYLKSVGAFSLNRGEYSRNDLVDATLKNDIESMTAIIKQHPEYVHQKDRNGWTPLHEAIRAGKAYAASHLIEFGRADVNVQTNIGATPLYMATHHVNGADENTIRYLVKMGGIEKGPGIDGDL